MKRFGALLFLCGIIFSCSGGSVKKADVFSAEESKEKYMAFYRAVLTKDNETAQKLLETENLNPNRILEEESFNELCGEEAVQKMIPDKWLFYKTPSIIIALSEGNTELVPVLLRHGASGLAQDSEKISALMWAVRTQNLEAVQAMAKSGNDFAKVDRSGMNALMMAAKQNWLAGVEAIVLSGAPLNEKGRRGTALMYAAYAGAEEIVRFLLESKADVNASSRYIKETALMHAADRDEASIAQMLLAAGANVNARTISGKTALTYAINNHAHKTLRLLLKNGADINTPDKDKNTPLLVAQNRRNKTATLLLEEAGAEKYAKAVPVKTLPASEEEQPQKLPEPDMAAIMLSAAEKGDIEAVRRGIREGGIKKIPTTRINDILAFALKSADAEIAQVCFTHGSPRTTLRQFENINPDMVTMLDERRAFVQSFPEYAKAVTDGDISVVREFLNKNAGASFLFETNWNVFADISITFFQQPYIRPVELAAFAGKIDIVKLLLERGAEITTNALFYAIQGGNSDIVRFFVESGCGLNTSYLSNGETPLMYAAKNKQLECMKILIDLGADLDRANNHTRLEPKTALDYCDENTETLRLLLDSSAARHYKKLYYKNDPVLLRDILNSKAAPYFRATHTSYDLEHMASVLEDAELKKNLETLAAARKDMFQPAVFAILTGDISGLKRILENAEWQYGGSPDDPEWFSKTHSSETAVLAEKIENLLADRGIYHFSSSELATFAILADNAEMLSLLVTEEEKDDKILLNELLFFAAKYRAVDTSRWLLELDPKLSSSGYWTAEQNTKINTSYTGKIYENNAPELGQIYAEYFFRTQKHKTTGSYRPDYPAGANSDIFQHYALTDLPETLASMLEAEPELRVFENYPLYQLVSDEYCDPEMLRIFMETPFSVPADRHQWMPVTSAARNNNLEKIKILLFFCPITFNRNQYDIYDKTALMYAAEYGNSEMTYLLLREGGDTSSTNDKGETPLSLARANKHEEIVKLLKDWGAKE